MTSESERAAMRTYYRKNRERILQRAKNRYYAHLEETHRRQREWKWKDREKFLQSRRQWYKKNIKKHREKARTWYQQNWTPERKLRKEAWCQSLDGRFVAWRNSAKARNLQWGLTKEFIRTLPLLCAYTGQPLTLEANRPNTISLDRIDNTKGYLPGNVVFCKPTINIMKRSFSVTEFQDLCQQVVDHKNKHQQAHQTKGNT